jgi:3-mercaptopyruvate sulfurtransferase SseA
MTTTNDSARVTALDPPAVRSLIETNPDVLLVDVRTPGEYESAHIAGSINLPLDKVNAHLRRIVNAAGRGWSWSASPVAGRPRPSKSSSAPG